MKWSFFLKTKDQQAEVLADFVRDLQARFGVKIKRWRGDNSGENMKTKELFEENKFGIKFEFTARETPQQNGKVERAFATLFGRVRALLNQAGFEKSKRNLLWVECAATATKLDNLLVTSSKETSPYEKFYGEPSPLSNHLRKFGEIGVVTKHNNNKIKSKLADRGVNCVFLGYARDHAPNVYRMLNLETNNVILTRDIVWLNKFYGEFMGITKTTVYKIDLDEEDPEPKNQVEIVRLDEVDEETEGDVGTAPETPGNEGEDLNPV
jgi:hypothetical protein